MPIGPTTIRSTAFGKMLLLNIILLPMVLAATRKLKIDDYVVEIANRTLMDVRMTSPSSESLNLSFLGLESIDSMALVNVMNTRYLDLSNNSLTDLPESVFSKLPYLEGLSLADNNIEHFTGAFIGLTNLRSLDISHNPVRNLDSGELFGLTEFIVISTLGNTFDRVSTSVFQNPSATSQPEMEPNFEPLFSPPSLPTIKSGIVERPLTTYSTEGFRICIEQGTVILLENWTKDEVLSAGCSKVHSSFGGLDMDDLGIVNFAEGWCRAAGSIASMSFRGNRIASLSPQMLNDLPHSVKHVDLSENKIERLSAGVISNFAINSLYLNDNLIREIEQGVFEMTKLRDLRLSGNKLTDTQFIATLPYGLFSLHLDRNEIEDITSFWTIQHFYLLERLLNDNRIRHSDVYLFPLQLSSLSYLDLSNNYIESLPPLGFRSVLGLEYLRLRGNNISHISIGAFSGLERLVELDLGRNRIKDIESFANALPHGLDRLFLDNNEIEELRAGTFVNVPKQLLDLRGNKISKIEKNSFIVPAIYGKESRVESLNSWPQALNPWWRHDYFAIFSSRKSFKREKGIGSVDLSGNPILKLKSGDLVGIHSGKYNYIYTSGSRIDSIEGGNGE